MTVGHCVTGEHPFDHTPPEATRVEVRADGELGLAGTPPPADRVGIDALAEALRHFLKADARAPQEVGELLLRGVPDDELKKILAAKGGKLRVVFDPLPDEMAPSVLLAESVLPGCRPGVGGEVDLNFSTYQGG